MLVAVMVACAGSMKSVRKLCFTDSAAAAMALVNGKSDRHRLTSCPFYAHSPIRDAMVLCFKYLKSGTDWANKIIKEGSMAAGFLCITSF